MRATPPPSPPASNPPAYTRKPAGGDKRLDQGERSVCSQVKCGSLTGVLHLVHLSTAPRFPLSSFYPPASPTLGLTYSTTIASSHSQCTPVHPFPSSQPSQTPANPSVSLDGTSDEARPPPTRRARSRKSRKGRLDVSDVFFDACPSPEGTLGQEGDRREGAEFGPRATTFVLPPYTSPPPSTSGRRPRRRVRRALRRMKEAFCVSDCEGGAGWLEDEEERRIWGAAAAGGAGLVAGGLMWGLMA